MQIETYRILLSDNHEGWDVVLCLDDLENGNGYVVFSKDGVHAFRQITAFIYNDGSGERWQLERVTTEEVRRRLTEGDSLSNVTNARIGHIDYSRNSNYSHLLFFNIEGNKKKNESSAFLYPPGNGSGTGGRP